MPVAPGRRLVLSGALALLLLFAAAPAHAITPRTINFDDATGPVGDAYFDGGALDGVRFSPFPFTGAVTRSAHPGIASSAPNLAALYSVAPPKYRPRDIAGDLPQYGSSMVAEFPFTQTHVAMNVGWVDTHTTARTATLRAYDVDENLLTSDTVTLPANNAGISKVLTVNDGLGRIQRVSIGADDAYGVGIDDFTFNVPDTPPPANFGFSWPGRVAGNVIIAADGTIDVPLAITRVNNSHGPIQLSAANLPAGVTATFLPNPATDTATHSSVTMRLHASSLASLVPVEHQDVTVTASPNGDLNVGSATRQLTVPVRVLAEYNLRARGLEITQGIQSGGPGQGLPQTPAGARAYNYAGVPLVAGAAKPTIARFYADASGAPKDGANADAILEGFRNGKPLPDSPLHPDGGGGILKDLGYGSTQVTYADRLDDSMPFDFTLPVSWVHGNITLKATVSTPPSFTPTGRECGQSFCLADNSVQLQNITFKQGSVVSVSPVQLYYFDRTKSGSPKVQQTDPFSPFDTANRVDPIRILAEYWRGSIDLTTHTEFVFPKGWVTRSFIADNGISRSDKSAEILDDIEDWADDKADANWPVGLIGTHNQYDGSTDDNGMSRGGPLFSDRPVAVVNPERPFASVTHELGHGLGRQHASGACGGGADGSDPWPDAFGYINGVGIDVSQPGASGGPYKILGGNMGKEHCTGAGDPDCGGATPAQPFDYMSYCAEFNNAWISDIGWNAILGRYNLGDIYKARAAQRARLRATPKKPGIMVRGYIAADGPHLTSVEHGRFAVASASAAAGSPVSLVATNASGGTVASAPLIAHTTHSDGDGAKSMVLAFEGAVPASSAAAVSVMRNGVAIAKRQRTAHAPSIRFIAPKKGAVVGKKKLVPVRFKTTDKDGGDAKVALDYSANGGRTYNRIFMGVATNKKTTTVNLPREFFTHSKRARLRLTADDGFTQTTKQSAVFRSLGAPPIVHVSSPAKGMIRAQDATLLLTGFAFDDAGKRMTKKRLTWYAGREKLGHGEVLSASRFPSGRQKVKLVAKDSTGRSASRSVTVRFLPVLPSFKALKAPKKISRRSKTLTLSVRSSVPTTLRIGSKHFSVGPHTKKVRLKVKPGRSTLKLTLKLGTGKLVIVKTVSVARA